MKEAQRYIRYILPGLAGIIIFVTTTWICNDKIFLKLFYYMKPFGGLSILGGLLLSSGALGYIFAQIHLAVYWTNPIARWVHNNPSNVLQCLHAKCVIIDMDGKALEPPSNRRETWDILNRFFIHEVETNDQKEKLISWLDSLTDFTHALGASIVGLITGFVAWVLVIFYSIIFGLGITTPIGVPIAFMAWMIIIYYFIKIFVITATTLNRTGMAAVAFYILRMHEDKNKGIAAIDQKPIEIIHCNG